MSDMPTNHAAFSPPPEKMHKDVSTREMQTRRSWNGMSPTTPEQSQQPGHLISISPSRALPGFESHVAQMELIKKM
jgi:hypothetical protein